MDQFGGVQEKAAGGGNNRRGENVGEHDADGVDRSQDQCGDHAGTNQVGGFGDRAEDTGSDDRADTGSNAGEQTQFLLRVCRIL